MFKISTTHEKSFKSLLNYSLSYYQLFKKKKNWVEFKAPKALTEIPSFLEMHNYLIIYKIIELDRFQGSLEQIQFTSW